MRASALISTLAEMVALHGDQDIRLDVGPDGLLVIQDAGFVEDEQAFVLWGAQTFSEGDLVVVERGPFLRLQGRVAQVEGAFYQVSLDVFGRLVNVVFAASDLKRASA